MIRILLIWFALGACFQVFGGSDLSVSFHYQQSPEPLTTEEIWAIDPEETNPHRTRWTLSKKTELIGLHTIEKGKDYGVAASGISSLITSFVRGPGPWYRNYDEFPCGRKVIPRFATFDGARIAADTAAKAWEELLDQEKVRLIQILNRISSAQPDQVLKQGNEAFRIWLDETEAVWRNNGIAQAKTEEWNFYLDVGKKTGVCTADGRRLTPLKPLPSWEEMMEIPPPNFAPRLLARAPARRWNELFSVRLSLQAGTHRIVGQFLLDSSVSTSILSPAWLQNQGVIPELVELPFIPPTRIHWGEGWHSESAIARRASVDGAELSGIKLPIKDFYLHDTEFFRPPDSFATCCDGVLGNDFLKRFVVEFDSSPNTEIKVFSPAGYNAGPEWIWVEAALTSSGEPISNCIATAAASKSVTETQLVGVRWNTDSEEALEIHVPWQARAKKSGSNWNLECGHQMIAKEVLATDPHPPVKGDSGPLSNTLPAMTAGIRLLSRGPFVFDFPHGRIWFKKNALSQPIFEDHSGLSVEYDFQIDGERVLHVKSIQPHSPASELFKAGLRPKMQITRINSQPVEDLQIWDIENILAGRSGDSAAVEWKTKAGLKAAPIRHLEKLNQAVASDSPQAHPH